MRYLLLLIILTFSACTNSESIGTTETEGPAKPIPIHQVNDLMKEGLKGKIKTIVKTQVLAVEKDGELTYETNKPGYHIIKHFDEDGFLITSMIRHDKTGTAQKEIYNYKGDYLSTIDHYDQRSQKVTVGYVKWNPPYGYTLENYGYSEQLKDTFAFEDYESTTLDKRYRLKTHIRIQGRDSNKISIDNYLFFKNNDLVYRTAKLSGDTSNYAYRIIVLERDDKGNPTKEQLYWHGDTEQFFIVHKYEYY